MAVKLRIKTHIDDHVHFAATMGVDYTLCGLETAGDEDIEIGVGVVTKEKVTCPHCLEIVRYCKTIRKNECDGL